MLRARTGEARSGAARQRAKRAAARQPATRGVTRQPATRGVTRQPATRRVTRQPVKRKQARAQRGGLIDMTPIAAKAPRGQGVLAEVGVSRALVIAATMIAAVTIQSTLLPLATLLGVIPQLVLVVTVSLAYLEGERVGVATGFAAGLLMDLLVPEAPLGVYALLYTFIGYGVASFRRFTTSEGVWTPVFVVVVASAVAEFGYAALEIVFGQPWISLSYTAKVAGLVVLYNTLLTPFVFPLVRTLAGRVRPEKIHRW